MDVFVTIFNGIALSCAHVAFSYANANVDSWVAMSYRIEKGGRHVATSNRYVACDLCFGNRVYENL